jgi:hypothetical protein
MILFEVSLEDISKASSYSFIFPECLIFFDEIEVTLF